MLFKLILKKHTYIKKMYYICKKNKMDKKELNKELINCLVKRSNLQREIRELYEDIEVLNAELYKKISRVVEASVELENLAERYIEIKLEQQIKIKKKIQ